MRRAPRSFTASLLLAACVAAPGLAASETALPGQQPTEEQLAERLRQAEKQLAEMRARLAEKDSQTARWDNVRSLYERALAQAPALANRPRLGVTIDTSSEDGAKLLDVLPSGPAFEAGLRAGDVVTHVDGETLEGGDDESPGQRLIQLVREAEGENMELRYERRGKTLLFVSHALQTVEEFCDTAYLIHKGKLVETGAPDEVILKYIRNYMGEGGYLYTQEFGTRRAELGPGRLRVPERVRPGAALRPFAYVHPS